MTADSDTVGGAIDRLLTVDFHGEGIVGPLHRAAASRYGESPTMLAARQLEEAVDEGDDVLVVTGFLLEPTVTQETDGPVGAAALARTLKTELGAHPTILADQEGLGTVATAAGAYGLQVADRDRARSEPWTCSIESIPTDPENARETADRLLGLDPAAVIAIERPGANPAGEYHMLGGTNVTDETGIAEPLFENAAGLTVAAGDGGNELGMGTIESTVREIVPLASACGCGCGEGIAATSEVDVLVPVTVSNWAAHGITAALSTLRDGTLLPPSDLEERALRQCGLAGAVDGVSGGTTGSCDGLSIPTHRGIVDCLHDVVDVSDC